MTLYVSDRDKLTTIASGKHRGKPAVSGGGGGVTSYVKRIPRVKKDWYDSEKQREGSILKNVRE